jgi:hypothetical protein
MLAHHNAAMHMMLPPAFVNGVPVPPQVYRRAFYM